MLKMATVHSAKSIAYFISLPQYFGKVQEKLAINQLLK